MAKKKGRSESLCESPSGAKAGAIATKGGDEGALGTSPSMTEGPREEVMVEEVKNLTEEDPTEAERTAEDLTVEDLTVEDLTLDMGSGDHVTGSESGRPRGRQHDPTCGIRSRHRASVHSAGEATVTTPRLRGLGRGEERHDGAGTPGSRGGGGNPAVGLDGGIPGGAALHHAAAGGQAEVIKILLNYNADVRALDSRGRTPLHWAAAKGVADAVQALLVHGGLEPMAAAAEHVDNDGYTPLGIARVLADAGSAQHVECVESLQRFSVQKAVEKARSRGGGSIGSGGRLVGSSRRGRRNR